MSASVAYARALDSAEVLFPRLGTRDSTRAAMAASGMPQTSGTGGRGSGGSRGSGYLAWDAIARRGCDIACSVRWGGRGDHANLGRDLRSCMEAAWGHLMRPSSLTQLVDLYLVWADRHYRKHGRRTRQYDNLNAMLQHLLAVEIPGERLAGRAPTRGLVDDGSAVRALRDVDPNTIVCQDMEDFVDHLAHLTIRGGVPIAVNTVNKYRNWTVQSFGWGVPPQASSGRREGPPRGQCR